MIVGRVIAWAFLLCALAVVGYEAFLAASSDMWHVLALGELWYQLHRASLNALQAGVQRNLAPWLWDPAMVWVLTQPAWAVFGVIGLIFAFLFRRRGRGAAERETWR